MNVFSYFQRKLFKNNIVNNIVSYANMNILITGGMGFFGVNAAGYLTKQGHSVVLSSSQPQRYKRYEYHTQEGLQLPPDAITIPQAMNILDQSSITAYIKITKPDIIIHAAALSQPAQCEKMPELAHAVNVEGTRNVLEVASRLAIPFIFLSTDLVFDGNKLDGSNDNNDDNEGWYNEDDTPNAHIVYGHTKIAAEQVITSHGSDQWCIVRPALMVGDGTPWTNGFPQFAVDMLKRGQSATLFTDQFRTPVWIDDICSAIECIVRGQHFGQVFHVGGTERMNRVDAVRHYCSLAGVDASKIHAVMMDAVPHYITRVRDVSLNSRRIQTLTGWTPTPLQEAFAKMLKET